MLLVAALGVAIRTQQRDLVRSIGTVRADGSPATEISYSRRQFSLLVALMTALTGACVIGAIHLFLGQGDVCRLGGCLPDSDSLVRRFPCPRSSDGFVAVR